MAVMEQNFAIITLYFVITLVLNTGNMDSERRCNPLLNSAPFGLDQYEKMTNSTRACIKVSFRS